MMRAAALLCAALALAACAGAEPSIPCSHFPAYSGLEQSVLADELATDGPQTIAEIEDYAKLMDECPQVAVQPAPTAHDIY